MNAHFRSAERLAPFRSLVPRSSIRKRSYFSSRFAAILLMSIALALEPAIAHSDSGLAGGFAEGFFHPILGPDHLLAMVAVGIWGSFLGRPLLHVLPIVFPTVMTVGAVLGMAGLSLPPVEFGIALSVILLGGLIAAAKSLPVAAASSIVATFAIFHGFAHGQELPETSDPIAYSAGFVLSTGLLHLVGIGFGFFNRLQGPVRSLPRLLGFLIAGAGAWFLAKLILA